MRLFVAYTVNVLALMQKNPTKLLQPICVVGPIGYLRVELMFNVSTA